MAPILMSAAFATHANAPRNPRLNSPMPMDATARFMWVLPRAVFVFSSVRSAARPCQWQDAAAACGSFGQPFEGTDEHRNFRARRLSLHPGGLPVFGRGRGRARF